MYTFLRYKTLKLTQKNYHKNYFCPICNGKIFKKISNWTYYCAECNYWTAFLDRNIESYDDNVFKEPKDKNQTISFLDDVRIKNFSLILNYLSLIRKNEKLSILDIGCATGLFLKLAKKRGFEVLGVEPNTTMSRIAVKRKLNVRAGYFPRVLSKNEKFDVITLNDVFEHIEDLGSLLIDIKKHLNHKGILIINLPNSDGVLFRLGLILAKIKMPSLWNRLWQIMFYTPHLHYFNDTSLNLLLTKYRFRPISAKCDMNFISYSGLWRRVCVDTNQSKIKKLFIFISALFVILLLKLIKRDAFFIAYKID